MPFKSFVLTASLNNFPKLFGVAISLQLFPYISLTHFFDQHLFHQFVFELQKLIYPKTYQYILFLQKRTPFASWCLLLVKKVGS